MPSLSNEGMINDMPAFKIFLCILTLVVLLATGCGQKPTDAVSAPSTMPPYVMLATMASISDNRSIPDKLLPAPHLGWYYYPGRPIAGSPNYFQITEYSLGSSIFSVKGEYRSYIETQAGQIRTNVVRIYTPWQWIDRTPFRTFHVGVIRSIDLETTGFPTSMRIWQDLTDHIFPGYGNKTLFIEIPQGVKAGEYKFEIGIEVDGFYYGNLPCTIKVIE
jgi:hypothetical protein